MKQTCEEMVKEVLRDLLFQEKISVQEYGDLWFSLYINNPYYKPSLNIEKEWT